MWHLFKTASPALVTLVIQPDAISCSIFTTHQKKIIYHVLDEIPLECSEIEKGIIFNISRLKTTILQFLKKHRATDCYVALTLPDHALQEKIITVHPHTFSTAMLIEHIPYNHVSNYHVISTAS